MTTRTTPGTGSKPSIDGYTPGVDVEFVLALICFIIICLPFFLALGLLVFGPY